MLILERVLRLTCGGSLVRDARFGDLTQVLEEVSRETLVDLTREFGSVSCTNSLLRRLDAGLFIEEVSFDVHFEDLTRDLWRMSHPKLRRGMRRAESTSFMVEYAFVRVCVIGEEKRACVNLACRW